MNKLLTALSLLLLTAITALFLTGCESMGGPFLPSDSGTTPTPYASPTQDIPFNSAIPGSDDTFMSDLGSLGEGIIDFAEGTVVDIASVPDVVKAVTDKYDKVTVTGITHAMHLGKQTYKVTYTDDNKTTHTVYVSPDGTSVIEAVEPDNAPASTGSPSPSASPDVSASPNESASPMPSETPAEEG